MMKDKKFTNLQILNVHGIMKSTECHTADAQITDSADYNIQPRLMTLINNYIGIMGLDLCFTGCNIANILILLTYYTNFAIQTFFRYFHWLYALQNARHFIKDLRPNTKYTVKRCTKLDHYRPLTLHARTDNKLAIARMC
jgi:hypothetical protein